MEKELIAGFFELWRTYFSSAELPIVCYYTDDAQQLVAA